MKKRSEIRIGTWNVRGIQGKEKELEDEFMKYNLKVLGITETKKKGQSFYITNRNNVYICSGIEESSRAAAGCGDTDP